MSALKSAWKALDKERKALEKTSLRELFAGEPHRYEHFCANLADLTLDYSKSRVRASTMERLFDLARAADVEARRDAMFAGETINETEGRAVLHVALRNRSERAIVIDGKDVMPGVRRVLGQIRAFSQDVRDGEAAGASGEPFTDVVNIGIGGSDLGPAMAVEALAPYRGDGPRVHFVSNVDGAHLADTLDDLDPRTTLFLVASKTFTTLETMTNANSARAWLVKALGEEAVTDHFAALSTNKPAVLEFGIDPDRIFPFEDWVGGRYSVWSAIGLSLAIAVGFQNFERFLAGAHAVDEHFRTAPLEDNLPVVMALLGVWHRNVWDYPTLAVIPYDQRLARFPAHLQQLDMESNGKRVTLAGAEVDHETGPIVWGEPGTNGQHAFFQLLHQGTTVVPVDFLLAARPQEKMGDHHAKLVANCLAQSEALAFGRTEAEAKAELVAAGMSEKEAARLAPHKTFPGDRPSSTLLYQRLDPFRLGSLIALYEHKVFAQGVIWNVNSFDQWGVELGKALATRLLPVVKGEKDVDGLDSSTAALVHRYRELA